MALTIMPIGPMSAGKSTLTPLPHGYLILPSDFGIWLIIRVNPWLSIKVWQVRPAADHAFSTAMMHTSSITIVPSTSMRKPA